MFVWCIPTSSAMRCWDHPSARSASTRGMSASVSFALPFFDPGTWGGGFCRPSTWVRCQEFLWGVQTSRFSKRLSSLMPFKWFIWRPSATGPLKDSHIKRWTWKVRCFPSFTSPTRLYPRTSDCLKMRPGYFPETQRTRPQSEISIVSSYPMTGVHRSINKVLSPMLMHQGQAGVN